MVTLPFRLIIEMGKIRLCKADRNYSLPPPLLRQKPTQGHWSFKKSFPRSLRTRVVTIKRFRPHSTTKFVKKVICSLMAKAISLLCFFMVIAPS